MDNFGFGAIHRLGENAMRPGAPPPPRLAALFVLAHRSAPRPLALPVTPVVALAGASNRRI